jgi:hypothetical protein
MIDKLTEHKLGNDKIIRDKINEIIDWINEREIATSKVLKYLENNIHQDIKDLEEVSD